MGGKPYRSTVVYDPDALQGFLTGARGKEERKAVFKQSTQAPLRRRVARAAAYEYEAVVTVS